MHAPLDIAGNTGPMLDEEIQGNIASMAELVRANGLAVCWPASRRRARITPLRMRSHAPSVYFARINPLTRFTLSESGELRFDNPAVRVDSSTAPGGPRAAPPTTPA